MTMNSTTYSRGIAPLVIVLIIAGVLAIGGGSYYLAVQNKSDINTNNNPSSTEEKRTLRTLINLGNNLQCTFTKDDNGANTEGSIYLFNTDMRGDFVTTTNGNIVNSHMIKTSENIYIWSDMPGAQGIKMKYSQEIEDQASQDSAVNFDEELDYSCTGWNQDIRKFVIPSSVHFIDLDTMLQGSLNTGSKASINGSASNSVDSCAICESIENMEAKTQCRLNLSCN